MDQDLDISLKGLIHFGIFLLVMVINLQITVVEGWFQVCKMTQQDRVLRKIYRELNLVKRGEKRGRDLR